MAKEHENQSFCQTPEDRCSEDVGRARILVSPDPPPNERFGFQLPGSAAGGMSLSLTKPHT